MQPNIIDSLLVKPNTEIRLKHWTHSYLKRIDKEEAERMLNQNLIPILLQQMHVPIQACHSLI